MPDLAIPTPPPNATEPPTENYWGYPADDTSSLTQMVNALPTETPAAAPEPAPAPPPAIDVTALQQKISDLESRLSAPPPSTPFQPEALAQAIVAGFDQAAQKRNATATAEAALTRPSLRVDDPDDYDPKLIGAVSQALNDTAIYAENLTRSQLSQLWQHVAPQLQAAQAIGQIAGPILNNQMRGAESQAAQVLAGEGIDAKTFNELLPAARGLIDGSDLPMERKLSMRLDPAAISEAIHIARRHQNGGVPVVPSAAPPSAPLPNAQVTGAPSGKTTSQRAVEAILGVKPNWEQARSRVGRSIGKNEGVN